MSHKLLHCADDYKLILTTDSLVTPDYRLLSYLQWESNQLIDKQVLIVNSFYAHLLFIRCNSLSSDMETMILQMFENIRVRLHVIGSQRTRRIYRLITKNIEIDHSLERVFLHLYSC